MSAQEVQEVQEVQEAQEAQEAPEAQDAQSSQSSVESLTPSEEWFREQSKKKTTAIRYSITSDHKPVYIEFFLKTIETKTPLIALTYNMSFASDLGIAMGSEAYFVQRAILADQSNPRAYWKNAAKLVYYFVNTKNPSLMYFQEMNDRVKIQETTPDFDGGYLELLELLAKPDTISYIRDIPYSVQGSRLVSYYTKGTYVGKNKQNYGFVAYSIKKGNTYPTLLTIWNIDTLGEFINFYGNDIGLHSVYRSNSVNLGRNFSCVKTSRQVTLINLHGPNEPYFVDIWLKKAIEDYMEEARALFDIIPELVVIGGDTNDTGLDNTNPNYNKSGSPDRTINPKTVDRLREIEFKEITYSYVGLAPLSCCAEFPSDVLVDENNEFKPYKYYGDKFFVYNFTETDLATVQKQYPNIYKNQLVIETVPLPGLNLAYGEIRKKSRNLKKKLLKQRKTIKKKHYKLNKKKSFNKRRIIRRKTRRHKRNH